jgi:Flp pilus assembly secretin CpaC
MFSIRQLVPAFSRIQPGACLVLLLLLLDPRSRSAQAADTAPAPPAAAQHASGAQVRLDVVVAEVRRGLMHNLASPLLQASGQTVPDGEGAPGPLAGVLSPRDGRVFLALLQGLRDAGLAKLVAEPTLVTQSGRPASFLSGGEQAVPVCDGTGQVGVRFVEFGTRVNFLATLLREGKVRLEVEPEVSRPDPAAGVRVNGTLVPGRITNRCHLPAEVKPGETVLVRGPVQRLAAERGDASSRQEEVELVLLVTPQLVGPAGSSEACEEGPEARPVPSAAAAGTEAGERLRRLERGLKRLQEELGDLRRDLRSLRPTDPVPPGER